MTPRVELIAECHTGHGGSVELAKEYVRAFAPYADFLKFQYTRVAHLRKDDPQYEWFTRAEMSDADFTALRDECLAAGTKLLLTVFNAADVPFVASLGLEAVKIGSGEAYSEAALVQAVDRYQWRVIMSEGLGYSLGRAHERLACVTRYPAPHGCVPSTFRRDSLDGFDGWSDHCRGLDSCQLALLRGATIIEKHVCLPHQARPVQPWEATVEEFTALRAFADDDPAAKYLGRWQADV
jgi:sialic acid synthase SpsE